MSSRRAVERVLGGFAAAHARSAFHVSPSADGRSGPSKASVSSGPRSLLRAAVEQRIAFEFRFDIRDQIQIRQLQ